MRPLVRGVLAASLGCLLSSSAWAQVYGQQQYGPQQFGPQQYGAQQVIVPPEEQGVTPSLSITVLTPPPPVTGTAPQPIVVPPPAAPAPVDYQYPPTPVVPETPPPATTQPQAPTVVIQINTPQQPSWEVVPTGGYPQPNVFVPCRHPPSFHRTFRRTDLLPGTLHPCRSSGGVVIRR
jgi:hypothetical protein